MPTHEECYWAMLALDALHNLDLMRLFKLINEVKNDSKSVKMRAELVANNSFKSVKTAMNVTPKHWLGPSHDPSTEECQKWRKISKAILNHVTSAPDNERNA